MNKKLLILSGLFVSMWISPISNMSLSANAGYPHMLIADHGHDNDWGWRHHHGHHGDKEGHHGWGGHHEGDGHWGDHHEGGHGDGGGHDGHH